MPPSVFEGGLRILIIALEVTGYFDIVTFCAALENVFERLPIHLRSVAAGQMIEFLFHSRRETHRGILGVRALVGSAVKVIGWLGFPDDFTRIFVVPDSDELGVPKVVRPRPLQEFDLSDSLRLEPNAVLHLLCG